MAWELVQCVAGVGKAWIVLLIFHRRVGAGMWVGVVETREKVTERVVGVVVVELVGVEAGDVGEVGAGVGVVGVEGLVVEDVVVVVVGEGVVVVVALEGVEAVAVVANKLMMST